VVYGLDIAQHSDAIKLSCESYIDRVLTTHGWSKPSPLVPSKPSAPLPVDAVTSLYANQGPPENTAEHSALANFYMLMLHVSQTLATPPLRYLSSPPVHMTITLPCSKMLPNAFKPLKTGVSFTVASKTHSRFTRRSSPLHGELLFGLQWY